VLASDLDRADETTGDFFSHVRAVRLRSREMWETARKALEDAQRLRADLAAQIERLARNEGFRHNYSLALLQRILYAAVAETYADFGNLQIFDHQTARLAIVAQQGFDRPFLDFFSGVCLGQAACGRALKRTRRVIVPDIVNSAVFSDSATLEVMLDAKVRAVQSTPIIGKSGLVLGILSTHYRIPKFPKPTDLVVIDHFATWAAVLIDWHNRLACAIAEAPRLGQERARAAAPRPGSASSELQVVARGQKE
jgi:hypothetical protein